MDDKISNFFSSNIWVCQGDKFYEIVYAIYLNDFQSSMIKSYNGLNEMASDVEHVLETFMKLCVLFYASHAVVLDESTTEHQVAVKEVVTVYKCHQNQNSYFLDRELLIYPWFYLGNEEIK